MFSKLFGWFKRHKILAVFLLLIVSLLIPILGFKFWNEYQYQRIETLHNKLSIPQDWELEESRRGGNASCIDLCRIFSRSYRVELDNEQAPQLLRTLIISGNFEVTKTDSKCEIPTNVYGAINLCSFEGKKEGYEIVVFYIPSYDKRVAKEQDISDDTRNIVRIGIRQVP